MSLDYSNVLAAIVTRIKANATVAANVGMLGDGADQATVYALRAHPQAASSKPVIVVTRVSSPQVAAFDKDAVTMRFDVHLFFGAGETLNPTATGTDCFAILDAVRTQLNRWVPTATGMTCSGVWFDNEIDAHDDESWHWVQSYTVTMTET